MFHNNDEIEKKKATKNKEKEKTNRIPLVLTYNSIILKCIYFNSNKLGNPPLRSKSKENFRTTAYISKEQKQSFKKLIITIK